MRAPAFQFYADDFVSGTADLSQSEVGAYVRLLCYQWNRGSIPVEPEKLERLAGGPVSADVLAKFPAWEDGLRRNRRLEHEREKQASFREKQRQKGIQSGLARRAAVQPRFNRGSRGVRTGSEPEANSPSPSPSPSSSPLPPLRGEDGGADSADDPPTVLPKGFPKTEAEARATAAFVGCTDELAVKAWNKAASRGGKDAKGQPIVSWRHYLAVEASYERSRQEEAKPTGAPGPGEKSSPQPYSTTERIAADKRVTDLKAWLARVKGLRAHEREAEGITADRIRQEERKLAALQERMDATLLPEVAP